MFIYLSNYTALQQSFNMQHFSLFCFLFECNIRYQIESTANILYQLPGLLRRLPLKVSINWLEMGHWMRTTCTKFSVYLSNGNWCVRNTQTFCRFCHIISARSDGIWFIACQLFWICKKTYQFPRKRLEDVSHQSNIEILNLRWASSLFCPLYFLLDKCYYWYQSFMLYGMNGSW